MKFETPIMNISMFEGENVVTIASGTATATEEQVNSVISSAKTGIGANNAEAAQILQWTY